MPTYRDMKANATKERVCFDAVADIRQGRCREYIF